MLSDTTSISQIMKDTQTTEINNEQEAKNLIFQILLFSLGSNNNLILWTGRLIIITVNDHQTVNALTYYTPGDEVFVWNIFQNLTTLNRQ